MDLPHILLLFTSLGIKPISNLCALEMKAGRNHLCSSMAADPKAIRTSPGSKASQIAK